MTGLSSNPAQKNDQRYHGREHLETHCLDVCLILRAFCASNREVITAAPPLLRRLARILDVFHHAGLLEFSAYLLAAATSFKFTLWYSNRKEILASRAWRDTNLTRPEKVFLMFAFVLLLCAAFVESYGIIHLTG
jgi:hypothetical protein